MIPVHVKNDAPPVLEAWYRKYLSRARFDISSSGVEPYRFGELRKLLKLSAKEMDAVTLEDGFTFGGTEIRRVIADHYARGDTSRVMVTHGSSEAIALLLPALLGPGDRVVVADPIYHSLRTFPELHGCEVVRVPAQEFEEPAACEHIRRGTKAVIVNFPHNPTGMALSPTATGRLVAQTEQTGAILIWDAAMAELPMCSLPPAPQPALPPNVISFHTLSKAFGLPGLRVGWCIAPPDLLDRTLALRDRTTLFLSPLVELIARRAIEQSDNLIGPRLARAKANLDYLDTFISMHADRLSWQRPQGGVCGLLKIQSCRDTYGFCEELVKKTGVLLVPGIAFERPNYVRIGYGGDPLDLRRALDLLATFLRTKCAVRID